MSLCVVYSSQRHSSHGLVVIIVYLLTLLFCHTNTHTNSIQTHLSAKHLAGKPRHKVLKFSVGPHDKCCISENKNSRGINNFWLSVFSDTMNCSENYKPVWVRCFTLIWNEPILYRESLFLNVHTWRNEELSKDPIDFRFKPMHYWPELKPLLAEKTWSNSLPVSIMLLKNALDSLAMYREVAPSIFNCLKVKTDCSTKKISWYSVQKSTWCTVNVCVKSKSILNPTHGNN